MISVNLGNEYLDSVAYQVAAHAVNLLGIPETVEIDICGDEIAPDLGACYWDGDSVLIVLDCCEPWEAPELARTLGHEMVHARQYATGDLNMIDQRTVKYRRKYYRFSNAMEYWLAPWEIEARGYETYFEQWLHWNIDVGEVP